MQSQNCLRVLVCFLLFLGVPSYLSAQVFTASVQGTITDSSGAVVPGAEVTITNEATNVKQTVKADEGGRYFISFLPPGSYNLTVEMAGFKKFVRSGMALRVDQQVGINVELSPGDVNARVEVTGEAPRLDAVSATLSQVFGRKTLEDLPLSSREAYAVFLLAPGIAVKQQWGNPTGTNFSSSGVRNSQSDVLIDGVTATTQEQNGGVTDLKFRPKVEMIEEIKVETSNFSAEFGNTGGTVINMVTRSGSNEFHGSGFLYNTNNYMSANGFFNNKYGVKPTSGTGPFIHPGEFGGTVGGPVVIPKLYNGKNRTFFFLHHDHIWQSSRGGGFSSVPTMLARNGDFSQTTDNQGRLFTIFNPNAVSKNASGTWVREPFANNTVPKSMMDKVATNFVTYYPQPNRQGLPYTNQNNYYAEGTNSVKKYWQTIKVDHNFSENHKIWARYSWSEDTVSVFPIWGWENPLYPNGIGGFESSKNGALDYTWVITPRTILSLRSGVVRQYARQLAMYEVTPISLDLSQFGFTNMPPVGMPPALSIEGYPALGMERTGRIKRAQDTEQITGSLTMLRGAHSIKFGGDGRLSHLNYGQPGEDTVAFQFARRQTMQYPLTATTLQGDGLASMLLGWGSGGTHQTDGYVASAAKAYSWFINDDWRVTRKLTINIGLRYELDIPRTERFDRENWFDRFVKCPLNVPQFPNLSGGYIFASPGNRNPFLTDWNNLAPRFGFAYQPLPKTVVRGGWGIFYGVSHANTRGRIGRGFTTSTPWLTSVDSDVTHYAWLSNPFPNGVNVPIGSSQGLMTEIGLGPNAVVPEWGNKPEYYQWNLSLQRELPANSVVEVAYAGTRGLHLPNGALRNIDRIGYFEPSAWSLGDKLFDQVPNPFYGIITNPTSSLRLPTVQRIQLLRPYPQFTSIAAKPGPLNADSIYHSLQLKFTKRYSYGVNLSAHYTFSKAIDDDSQNGSDTQWMGGSTEAQTFFNLALERSLSTWDQRHRFVMDFTWEVPVGRNQLVGSSWNKWLDAVLGQWQINGIIAFQSALPLAALLGSGNLPDATQRPDLLTDPRIPGSAAEKYERYFNTTAFSQPKPYTFGTAPRVLSTLRGPFMKNVDASLFKKFVLAQEGRVYLQVSLNAFNATNRVTFADPNMTFGSGSFGQITSTAIGARSATLAAKLYF
jgi:hypothetical protein